MTHADLDQVRSPYRPREKDCTGDPKHWPWQRLPVSSGVCPARGCRAATGIIRPCVLTLAALVPFCHRCRNRAQQALHRGTVAKEAVADWLTGLLPEESEPEAPAGCIVPGCADTAAAVGARTSPALAYFCKRHRHNAHCLVSRGGGADGVAARMLAGPMSAGRPRSAS